MRFNTNAEIKDIYAGLVTRTLPKAEWTHAAHFAAAISMLASPDKNPFETLPDIIRGYNVATGVENTDSSGYHQTITMASILAAEHVLETAPKNLERFELTNRLLLSEYGSPDWILDYWTKPVLFSPEARAVWVAPDKCPLPFSVSKLARA